MFCNSPYSTHQNEKLLKNRDKLPKANLSLLSSIYFLCNRRLFSWVENCDTNIILWLHEYPTVIYVLTLILNSTINYFQEHFSTQFEKYKKQVGSVGYNHNVQTLDGCKVYRLFMSVGSIEE